jgi:hypothetical protein
MAELTALHLDPDPTGGDSLAAMAAHLVGPLGAAVRGDAIALDAAGSGRLPGGLRQPLVIVALREDLAAAPLVVSIAIGSASPVELRFAPHSERGAALAVPAPAAVNERVVRVVGSAANVSVRYVDGVLPRLLYVLGLEKARVRSAARHIAAARVLEHATGSTLDRIGEELRVPRFRAQVSWSATERNMTAVPENETDSAYRERLRIYRPRVRPTREALEEALRGRLSVLESDSELAIAIKLVSPPDDQKRKDYIEYLRKYFLLPVTATELPASRPVSGEQRDRAKALLARLAVFTTWPAGAMVAPAVAAAIDRSAQCIAALGGPARLAITRAQSTADGSRYELGLGVDVDQIPPATLDQMVAAHRASAFVGTPSAETRALLASMVPASSTDDPHARWLWRACGMRTVHPISVALGPTTPIVIGTPGHPVITGPIGPIISDRAPRSPRLYLSHLPIHGATLEVTPASAGTSLQVVAVLNDENDTGRDANLGQPLRSAEQASPLVPPWQVRPMEIPLPPVIPPPKVLAAFAAAGVRAPQTPEQIASALAALGQMPGSQVAVLALHAQIMDGMQGLPPTGPPPPTFADVVGWLRKAGVVSVLPFVLGPPTLRCFVVVGASELPGGTILNRRRAEFRWLTTPVGEDRRIGSLDTTIKPVNHYVFGGPGSASQLAAIIALTPTRPTLRDLHQRIEPGTFAVDVPADRPLLGFAEYEYLMNFIERWCPLGITVDTSRLRAGHVDLDADGAPDLLDRQLQHSFRPYRGRRPLGRRD